MKLHLHEVVAHSALRVLVLAVFALMACEESRPNRGGVGPIAASPSLALVAPPVEASHSMGSSVTSEARGLEVRWLVRGNYASAVFDAASGSVYAARWRLNGSDQVEGALLKFDRFGKQQGAAILQTGAGDAAPYQMRMAHLTRARTPAVVSFSKWGGVVSAWDLNGKMLWMFDAKEGVDDVWTGSMAGPISDAGDSVMVGCNGFGDLIAIDGLGKEFWRDTTGGNWFSVSGGSTGPGGVTEIVATKGGRLVRYDGISGKREELGPKLDLGFVCMAASPALGKPTIVVKTNARELIAMERDGTIRWRTLLPPCMVWYDGVVQGAEAPTRPWIALAMSEGRVLVYDLGSGACVASTTIGERFDVGSVDWMGEGGTDGPLLLIASRAGLSACAVQASPAK